MSVWSKYGDTIDFLLFALVVVVVAAVVTRIGTIAVRRLQRRMEAASTAKQELALQRAATVAHALNYAVRVAVWSVAALTILGRANIELGPLIAGAGVAGVALGFGAQSIVRDYLAGFYLLIEDQLDVGDSVDLFVGGVKLSGRVTELTLRTTWLRTDEGQVHVVPNGGIAYVTNHSRGAGDVRVTIRLEPRDETEIRRAVDAVLRDAGDDPRLRIEMFDRPAIRRLERAGDALELEIGPVSRPDFRDSVAALLRDRLHARLRPLFAADTSAEPEEDEEDRPS